MIPRKVAQRKNLLDTLGEILISKNLRRRWFLPDFVVHFLVFEYFQGSNLIEYFRFVEADQVVDYYVWGPNVLTQERQTLIL